MDVEKEPHDIDKILAVSCFLFPVITFSFSLFFRSRIGYYDFFESFAVGDLF